MTRAFHIFSASYSIVSYGNILFLAWLVVIVRPSYDIFRWLAVFCGFVVHLKCHVFSIFMLRVCIL